MIGNDIVDLNFAKQHSRWQEQRFLDKLFSQEEQDFILSDGNRFENIWRFWSMKESAYKIISRADGIIRFNPKDFKCFAATTSHGQVVFQNKKIATVSKSTLEFSHTTAFLESNWISEVFQFTTSDIKSQKCETHKNAIKAYAVLKNLSQDNIAIINTKIGVPQFYVHGYLQNQQLSLTHHGHFGAFAIAV